MPTSTSLVTNLPADFNTFGQGVDTSMAQLKGGSTGQVLSKTSATDMAFTWITPDDANAIQNAIVDAKGDLIAATAADTPARLAVGTNGQILTADSTAATGLAWATPATPTFVGCILYDSGGTQSISTGTWTAVTFDSESVDTDSYHSTSSNTSRVTVPTGKAGKYRLTYNNQWPPNGTGVRTLNIYKNGSSSLYCPEQIGNSSYYIGTSLTFTITAAVGDYFEVYVYQTSGGSLNVFKRATENPLTFEYLGA